MSTLAENSSKKAVDSSSISTKRGRIRIWSGVWIDAVLAGRAAVVTEVVAAAGNGSGGDSVRKNGASVRHGDSGKSGSVVSDGGSTSDCYVSGDDSTGSDSRRWSGRKRRPKKKKQQQLKQRIIIRRNIASRQGVSWNSPSARPS